MKFKSEYSLSFSFLLSLSPTPQTHRTSIYFPLFTLVSACAQQTHTWIEGL